MNSLRKTIFLALPPLLLFACAQPSVEQAPPIAASEPALPLAQRSEAVCPVIRFLVAGEPAEAQGYDVKEAITAARQLFREQGLELVTVDRLLDRFQRKSINLRTPLANDPASRQASSAQMDESIRKSIRNALNTELSQFGEAEMADCPWILTGQVDVSRDRTDPRGPSRIVDVATWLTIVEASTNRGVGDAFSFGEIKGPNPATTTRRGLVYSLESVAATTSEQIQNAATNYTIILRMVESGRRRAQMQQALEGCGFAIQSSNDGDGFRRVNAGFQGSITDAEVAVGCALDRYEQESNTQGSDYRLEGRLLTIEIPST